MTTIPEDMRQALGQKDEPSPFAPVDELPYHFDEKGLTIQHRALGGIEVTIVTKHEVQTVVLTEEREGDLARWLGGDEAQAERTKLALSEERRIAAKRYMRERNEAVVERDEWKAIATSTEETLKLQQGASIEQLAEANRTGQAMGAAAEREQIVAMIEVAAKNMALAVAVSEFGVSCVLGALEGLVEEIRAGSHRPDPTPLDALVEPRDTEPPRREAVAAPRSCPGMKTECRIHGCQDNWEWCKSAGCQSAEGTPAPDPLRRLTTSEFDQVPPVDDAAVDRALRAGQKDRDAAVGKPSTWEECDEPTGVPVFGGDVPCARPKGHSKGHGVQPFDEDRGRVMPACGEGTPAPEPPPPDGWSDIPTELTGSTRGCEHKESGRRAWVDNDGLRCMDEMGDDEPCPVDVALWLLAGQGTPGSTKS